MKYAVRSVISISIGWCCEGGGRADQGREAAGVDRGPGSGGRGGGGGMLRGNARRSISHVAGVMPRQTECLPYYVPPHLPTTRLFNTCRIRDASFFMLNDRAA